MTETLGSAEIEKMVTISLSCYYYYYYPDDWDRDGPFGEAAT